jgi:hypothetical protein
LVATPDGNARREALAKGRKKDDNLNADTVAPIDITTRSRSEGSNIVAPPLVSTSSGTLAPAMGGISTMGGHSGSFGSAFGTVPGKEERLFFEDLDRHHQAVASASSLFEVLGAIVGTKEVISREAGILSTISGLIAGRREMLERNIARLEKRKARMMAKEDLEDERFDDSGDQRDEHDERDLGEGTSGAREE